MSIVVQKGIRRALFPRRPPNTLSGEKARLGVTMGRLCVRKGSTHTSAPTIRRTL